MSDKLKGVYWGLGEAKRLGDFWELQWFFK